MSEININTMLENSEVYQQQNFQDQETFAHLQTGQQPNVMVISCCDSRVDPALIFNTKPGDLFISRNVANLVGPYKQDDKHCDTACALEYAVKALKVTDIVVLGHSKCGGIKALVDTPEGEQNFDFVESWVATAKPAKVTDGNDKYTATERASVLNSIQNLMTYPWIVDAVSNGTLKLHGWRFNLENGQVEKLSS